MRRWRWVAAVVVAVAAATAVTWWASRGTKAPKSPPEVAADDPAVAAAVAAARAEVVARPADADAWGRLGQTLLANGLLDPARECFAEAGRLNPRDVRWPYLEGVSLLLRDPTAALPLWERAAACPGDDDRATVARLRWAEALAAADRPHDAAAVFRSVLAADPGNARAHLGLGLSTDDPHAAIDHLRRCADHPSARRAAAVRLAALYARLGDPAQAAEFARRAEQLPPDSDWPDPIRDATLPFVVGRQGLFLQAEKTHLQGDARRAAMLFGELIRRHPEEDRAYTKLGMILAEAGQYREAEDVLRAGLRVSPGMVQGHYFLAVALFHQAEQEGFTTTAGRAKAEGAAEAAGAAVQLKPDHGFAHLYRGLALKHLGRTADAVAALRESVRCAPEAADTHLHLGQALAAAGLAADGIAELEAAVRLSAPTDSRARLALARVRERTPTPSSTK